jgi:hypothetical protein
MSSGAQARWGLRSMGGNARDVELKRFSVVLRGALSRLSVVDGRRPGLRARPSRTKHVKSTTPRRMEAQSASEARRPNAWGGGRTRVDRPRGRRPRVRRVRRFIRAPRGASRKVPPKPPGYKSGRVGCHNYETPISVAISAAAVSSHNSKKSFKIPSSQLQHNRACQQFRIYHD